MRPQEENPTCKLEADAIIAQPSHTFQHSRVTTLHTQADARIDMCAAAAERAAPSEETSDAAASHPSFTRGAHGR